MQVFSSDRKHKVLDRDYVAREHSRPKRRMLLRLQLGVELVLFSNAQSPFFVLSLSLIAQSYTFSDFSIVLFRDVELNESESANVL